MSEDAAGPAAAPNHIGFTVDDLDGGIRLLTGCFGFRLLDRGPRPGAMAARLTGVADAEVEIAFLGLPGLSVELLRFANPAEGALPAPNRPGAAHLALEVGSITATMERGREHGLRMLGEIVEIPAGPNRGGRVAYVQQAGGLTLELIQRAE